MIVVVVVVANIVVLADGVLGVHVGWRWSLLRLMRLLRRLDG